MIYRSICTSIPRNELRSLDNYILYIALINGRVAYSFPGSDVS